MSVVLYHRTTIAQAREIAKHGFEDAKWNFGVHDVITGDELKVSGVWLADRPLSEREGPAGDAVLEVTLDLAADALVPYELDGVVSGARLWVPPAALINPCARVRILEVNPRTSWWYETQDAEQDVEEEEEEE